MKKKDFVRLHRELWNGVADYCENQKGDHRDDLPEIKEKIIRNMIHRKKLKALEQDEYDLTVEFGCFACGHARCNDHMSCKNCPLDWGVESKEDYVTCELENTVYSTLYEEIETVSCNWEKAAELARKVRDLPVRDEVFEDD